MSLPQNLIPEPETTVTQEPVVTELVTTEPAATVDSATTEETAPVEPVVDDTAASDPTDAELRAWASANGIEGVPASGKLSAAWREQITAAMAAEAAPEAPEEPEPAASEEAEPAKV